MIIVKVLGGLGNQLFQYATGTHIADRFNSQLKFDLEHYKSADSWPLYFDELGISYDQATQDDIERVIPFGDLGFRSAYKLSFSSQFLAGKLFNLYKERSKKPSRWATHAFYKWNFDPNLLDVGPDAYLHGYWQSEQYFTAIADELRDDLKSNRSFKGQNQEVVDAIDGSTTAVSVHVRRGDYKRRGMQLAADYYDAAFDRTNERVEDPQYFVFGVGQDWARKNLQVDAPITFVDHNDAEGAVQDFRLMSRCDHNIIANSTFSWWAAWLNENPDKTILVPMIWHSHVNLLEESYDVIPERWEIVEF